MKIRRRAALAAVLVSAFAVGILATACDDGDTETATGTTSASQGSVDELSARMQQNEMLFALVSIEALELHEIDDSVQEGAPLERAVPDVRKFVRIMALTNWESELATEADDVHDLGVAWLNALDEGDVEVAKGPSGEAHEAFHEFAENAWNVVVKDLPPDEGGPDEHDEEEGTPASEESPAAEATP